MSEYQYVAFRAIDRPVGKKDLDFMRRQSTRAEITPWTFDNEYEFGDFRGDAVEMLRRGYDFHLHYANFGVRCLMIRLPLGLPDSKSVKPFLTGKSLEFVKDKQGPGGCLRIDPNYESGQLQDLWDFESLLPQLMSLRTELIDGDLRPLYLAHLAVALDCNHDVDEMEAPVPGGLNDLTDAQRALTEFYELGSELIASAALESLPMPDRGTPFLAEFDKWVRQQPSAMKDAWLSAMLAAPNSTAREDILAEYRSQRDMPAWPVSRPSRTIGQLQKAANEIARKAKERAAANASRQRAKRLAQMAADPEPTLWETEKLVSRRTKEAYRQIAEMLAEVREALAASGRSDVAEKQAQKLQAKHPTLRLLVSELRLQGFVQK